MKMKIEEEPFALVKTVFVQCAKRMNNCKITKMMMNK